MILLLLSLLSSALYGSAVPAASLPVPSSAHASASAFNSIQTPAPASDARDQKTAAAKVQTVLSKSAQKDCRKIMKQLMHPHSAGPDIAILFNALEDAVSDFLKNHISYGYGDVVQLADQVFPKVQQQLSRRHCTLRLTYLERLLQLIEQKYDPQPVLLHNSLVALTAAHIYYRFVGDFEVWALKHGLFGADRVIELCRRPERMLTFLTAEDKQKFHIYRGLDLVPQQKTLQLYQQRREMIKQRLQPILEPAYLQVGQRLGLVPAHNEVGLNSPESSGITNEQLDYLVREPLHSSVDIIAQYAAEVGWHFQQACQSNFEGSYHQLPYTIDDDDHLEISPCGIYQLTELKKEVMIPLLRRVTCFLNPVHTVSPSFFTWLSKIGKNLQIISLINNQLVEIDVAPFAAIKSLKNLNLRENDLMRVEGLEMLSPQLDFLDLSCNRLSGDMVSWITCCWMMVGAYGVAPKNPNYLKLDGQRPATLAPSPEQDAKKRHARLAAALKQATVPAPAQTP